jgi:hypothetical protein
LLGLVGAAPAAVRDPRIGLDHCEGCGVDLDISKYLDGSPSTPKPGDRTVCQHCGAFMKYTNEMELVLLTADEVTETLKRLNAEELRVVKAMASRRTNRGGNA